MGCSLTVTELPEGSEAETYEILEDIRQRRASRTTPRPEDVEFLLAELRRAQSRGDNLAFELHGLEYVRIKDNGYLIDQRDKYKAALREIADTFEIDWHEAQEIARDVLEEEQ